MKLISRKQHRSIESFPPIEVPDFLVLTGINGSGKTHLLQAIENGNVRLEGHESPKIVLFNYEDFYLNHEAHASRESLMADAKGAWKSFTKDIKNELLRIKQAIPGSLIKMIEIVAEGKKLGLWYLDQEDFSPSHENSFVALENYKKSIEDYFSDDKFKNHQYSEGILLLLREQPYFIDEITEETFIQLYKPREYKKDFLPSALSKVFMDYHVRYDDNRYSKYRKESENEEVKFLSEKEFAEKYGEKPWNVINDLLSKLSNFDYRISSPEELNRNSAFHAKLTHIKKEGLEIAFNELSSGERTMLALIASVYQSAIDDHRFPDILLLDEIDASLHPSMIRDLIDTIQEVFLNKGVKVILATHSPTMIALAPEESIFVVNKDTKSVLRKTSRGKALSLLTEGFATLEEGLKLFDQISQREISILTEGHNAAYIEKALSMMLEKEDKNKVEVINGVESITGKDQLKTIYRFFSKAPHDKKVLFVWDCDVTFGEEETNNTFYFVFEKNTVNNKVQKGIENLFAEKDFKPEFYTTKNREADGGKVTILDKNKFKSHILKNGTCNDFEKFRGLIDKVRALLSRQSSSVPT